MAVGEPRKNWVISQVSRTDWTALDQYYWLEHSFIYSANINCDDELHGIKLSQKVINSSSYSDCQLVSAGEHWVFAIPLNWWTVSRISCNGSSISWSWTSMSVSWSYDVAWATIFQDSLYVWWNASSAGWFYKVNNTGAWSVETLLPFDHPEATDESISNKDNVLWNMEWNITAILNYNNTRLVVAAGSTIWVYYPELDQWPISNIRGSTGWKKVMDFEAGVKIVWLTCTFEYLKVWAVDEWWNTKVYYYQGNNNLRDTFVYNVIDLTGEKVTRVYSINSVDYYVSSVDWTDWYVNFNKMVGNVPVPLFKQRAGLTPMDINTKDPYFVWPCSIDAAYQMWSYYVADAYWIFKFNYTANSYDKWYMKWKLNSSSVQPAWLCICANFLYFSDANWCHAVRIYDTGKDWYQLEWVLISREYEWQYWWCVTKMIDEIRLAYEMNPRTNSNWWIDVYVSPNNLWTSTYPVWDGSDWWYHVMSLTQENALTRIEVSYALNNFINNMPSAFGFDWQTLNYCIKITRGTEQTATPIVRWIEIRYHTKDKTNLVEDIQ